MEKVKIKTEYIKLDQLLKYVGIAENGAHAKEIILLEEVFVNHEIEKRRGRKLYKGDIITLNEVNFIIE